MNFLEQQTWQKIIAKRDHQLLAVFRIFQVLHGEIDQTTGPLELIFDLGVLLLHGREIDTLFATETPWVDPFLNLDSAENRNYIREYGKDERVDVSREEPYAHLVGQRMHSIYPIFYIFPDATQVLSGVQFGIGKQWLNCLVKLGEETYVLWGKRNRAIVDHYFVDEAQLK